MEMNRALLILVVLLAEACSSPAAPSPVYPGYFLSTVDGALLPVPFAEDGSALLAGSLAFGDVVPAPGEGTLTGLVSYNTLIRRADQSVQHSVVELNYTISNGLLRINLCPSLALCLISTELVGPILGRTSELVLTHYLGGTPGSVYSFFPALPE